MKALIAGFFDGSDKKLDTLVSQIVLDGFLKIDIIMMTMHCNRLSGQNDLVALAGQFAFPVE